MKYLSKIILGSIIVIISGIFLASSWISPYSQNFYIAAVSFIFGICILNFGVINQVIKEVSVEKTNLKKWLKILVIFCLIFAIYYTTNITTFLFNIFK